MGKKAVLRLLCGLVDGIIVMFASQVILIGLFDIHTGAGLAAQAYFMMIFCVYNALFVRAMQGQTPGKAIGRLVVLDAEFPLDEGKRPSLYALFLRESCKAFYLFPVIGWLFGIVSLGLLLGQKEPIHDRVGKTAVVFVPRGKR